MTELSRPNSDDASLKQAVFEQSAAGIAVTDLDGLIVLANHRFEDIVNLTGSINTQINDALNQAISTSDISDIKEVLLNKEKDFYIFEVQAPFYSTHITWCIIKVSLLDHDQQTRLIFVVDDISGNRQTVPRMSIHLMSIIDNLPILIAHIDQNNRYVFANKTYESFFNTTLDKVIGAKIPDVIGEDAYSRSESKVRQARLGKTISYDNTIFYTNELRVLHITLVPGDTDRGNFYIYGQDVTELRTLQHSLEYKAYHDSLTGLPNRNFFMKSLNSVLKRNHPPSALLFIDVDGLKIANDSYGHEIGDKLIMFFAETFNQLIRPRDVVSRLAGDEFTIILTELEHPVKNTEEICQRIIETLPETVDFDGKVVPCSCSIGAVILDNELGLDADSWIGKADTAMYKVKNGGKRGYVIETNSKIERSE